MNQIVHRRYVSYGDAHYGGGLVDGAYVMRIFGEVATELSVLTEGDEGLLAGYEVVDFHAPVLAGDLLEVTGRIASVGRRSRRLELNAYVTSRSDRTTRESGAVSLPEKMLVTTAVAVLVVPEAAK